MNPVPLSLMRERVEIQARTTAPDSYGQPIPTWATVATVWGKVEPLSGREAWQAQSVRPDVTHKVSVRYYAGLTPKHRFRVDGTRVFSIEAVLDIEDRHRVMECMCKEEV